MMHRPGRDLKGREVKRARVEHMAPTLLKMLGIEPKNEGFGGPTIRAALEAGR
jgi:hypothetical protein